MGSIPEEIAALRRRLAEIELMAAAEQRPDDAARSEVDVVIRRVSAQGRGAANASRTAKEKNQ